MRGRGPEPHRIFPCRPLLGVLLLALNACGWHPVYVPGGGQDVPAWLGRVDVALIPERQGQVLRQALQARLQHAGSEASPDFVLEAGYAVNQEGLGIMPDSSVTRIRLVATSTFVVRALAQPRTCLSGSVRVVDGYDTENQQFFASDLEGETVQRRLAGAVADQIVLRLARGIGASGDGSCEVR